MVRVRIGTSWRQDPGVRAALARGGAEAVRAAEEVVDALALEVDGVDAVAGRGEGALVGGLEGLGAGLLRLLGGAPRAEVHFGEGGVELVLARRGASALLTVVALARPARVLARDVEVDLLELAGAVVDAARTLAGDLRSLQGASGTTAVVRLQRVADRLAAARPAQPEAPPRTSPTPSPAPAPRAGAPTCAVELRDDDGLVASYRGPGADLGSLLAPGRVALRAADGRELAAVAGPPFLVLRDLSSFAGAIAEAAARGERLASAALAGPGRTATVALEADLAAGTLARDDRPPVPCPPLPLARALLEAAIDFCGVVTARNPWQVDNGWLAELRTAAAERLAHVQELLAGDQLAEAGPAVRGRRAPRLPRAPLGPGRVRRLVFRRAWEAEVGPPAGFGLAPAGPLLLAVGEAAALALDPTTGAERWRLPGAARALLVEGTLLLTGRGAGAPLEAVDPVTGRLRWTRPAGELPEGATDLVRLPGGLCLLVGPGGAAALDPATGAPAWRLDPPGALRLRAAALGPLAVLGSDAGFLYAVEAATGRPAWRVRLPGPLAAPPFAHGDACLALCTTALGGSLMAVAPATGRRRFELPLDVAPTGPLLPFAGLLAVPGAVAGDPVVTALEPAGRLLWEAAPPLGSGPVVLVERAGGLVAKASGGACAALDRAGAVAWTRVPPALHPPPANAAPVVARGVVLVPGEGVAALAEQRGELLGEAPLPAPVRLCADAALRLWSLDAAGVLTAVRLETHLGVVDSE